MSISIEGATLTRIATTWAKCARKSLDEYAYWVGGGM